MELNNKSDSYIIIKYIANKAITDNLFTIKDILHCNSESNMINKINHYYLHGTFEIVNLSDIIDYSKDLSQYYLININSKYICISFENDIYIENNSIENNSSNIDYFNYYNTLNYYLNNNHIKLTDLNIIDKHNIELYYSFDMINISEHCYCNGDYCSTITEKIYSKLLCFKTSRV